MLSGNLPQDLVIEILSRTPAKSLIRFHLVCKSWRDLFQDLRFVIKHKKTRSANINGYCFFAHQHQFHEKSERSSLLHRDGETATGIRCENLLPFPCHLSILAAADDILFVEGTNNPLGEYLWNPTTREFRKVPSFKTKALRYKRNLFGLSFDFKSNDVKVVAAFTIQRNSSSGSGAAVWSSRIGSWREIKAEIPNHSLTRTKQLLFVDKCYWHVHKFNAGGSSILSFDFVDEKFLLIPLPDQGCWGTMIAAELKQSIGYAVFQPDEEWQDEKVTIWLLSNENPVSWYKYITLTSPCVPSGFDGNEKWLVCFEREVVIMGCEGDMVFHNLITREIMSSKIMGTGIYSDFHVYRESLVSFKDGN